MAYSRAGKPIVTAGDIVSGLREVGVRSGDRMFVHSSLSAFGYVDGGAEAVCDAFLETVGPTGTAAVPTFTWGRNHDADTVVFDVRSDPCELGQIPEAFRRRPDAVRSEHLCHSVAAIGPDAEGVMGDGIRPFAWGSSMYRLYELNFCYILLGCGFGSCTALHTAEELMQVRYRSYRDFKGSTVIRADGRRAPSRAVEFLRRGPYHNDFAKMSRVFEGAGLLRTTTVGNARIVSAATRDLVNLAVARLRDDVGDLLDEASRRRFAECGKDLAREP